MPQRLRELQAENAKLKKLLAEAHLDLLALKSVVGGKALAFLSDNGGAYIAADTRALACSLGLQPINTPVCSPQSNLGDLDGEAPATRPTVVQGADTDSALPEAHQMTCCASPLQGRERISSILRTSQ